jgi:hypothetical protein
METKTPDNNEVIIGRMDVIINLLLKLLEKEGKDTSAKDKIIMLDSFGLSPKEISKVINSNSNYVSVQLSLYRKSNKPNTQNASSTNNNTAPSDTNV